MTEIKVRLHNSDRMQKVEKDGTQIMRRNRPHAYYKEFTYLKIPRIMAQFGYDYKTENATLR
jgi:hypothetical protein